MKKLLFALAAAGGFALTGAATATDSTGFETTESLKAGHWWYSTSSTSEDGSSITAYQGSEVAAPVKENWYTNQVSGAAADGETSFLALSTEGGTLYRSINEAAGGTGDASTGLGTAIDLSNGNNLYIDTLVQFTVCEDEPTVDANAKLAIWLGVVTNAAGEVTSTNLFVKANSWDGVGATETVFQCGQYEAGEWYRLTVSAYANVLEGGDAPGFTVAIDGMLVTPTVAPITGDATTVDGLAAGTTFLSLDQSVKTLAGVGFQGTGAVDNYVVSNEDPFFTMPTAVDFTLTLGENVSSVSYTIGSTPGTANATTALQLPITATGYKTGTAETFTITGVTYANGYMDAGRTANNLTANDDAYTVTDIFSAASLSVSAGLVSFRIGETPYASLADALTQLTSGQTLTLARSLTLEPESSSNGITLNGANFDLGGNTLTFNGSNDTYAVYINGGTVMVTNGTIVSDRAGIGIEAATVALGGLTVTSTNDAVDVYAGSTVAISDGTYTAVDIANEASALYVAAGVTFTVADGTTFSTDVIDYIPATQYLAGEGPYVVTANPAITIVQSDGIDSLTPAAGTYYTYRPGTSIAFTIGTTEETVKLNGDAITVTEGSYTYASVPASDTTLTFTAETVVSGIDFTATFGGGNGVTAVSYTVGEAAPVAMTSGVAANITGLEAGDKVTFTLTTDKQFPQYKCNGSTCSSSYEYTVLAGDTAVALAFSADELGKALTINAGTGVDSVSYTINGNAPAVGQLVGGGETVVITPTAGSGITYPVYTVDGTTFGTATYTYTVAAEPSATIALTVTAVDATSSGSSDAAAATAAIAGTASSAANAEAATTKIGALVTEGASVAAVATWMEANDVSADGIAGNSYVSEAYNLNTTLFSNQPTAEVTAMGNDEDGKIVLSFQIKDGNAAKTVDAAAAYVTSMVECSEDLSFETKLSPTVEATVTEGQTLTVKVTPPSGKTKAFLRIKK